MLQNETTKRMRAAGITVTDWANYNGYSVPYTMQVIGGQSRWQVGKAAEIIAKLKKSGFWVEPKMKASQNRKKKSTV